jgi:hypothetical protein
MGYTVMGRGSCPDCGRGTVQLLLDTDRDGNDDQAGVGWFHVVGPNSVREGCPSCPNP